MLRTVVTIPVSAVIGMLSAVRQRWADTPGRIYEIVQKVGIEPGLFVDPAARVTAQQFVALYSLLVDELDDECIGFLSRPLRRGSLTMILRSAMGSHTVEGALNRIARAVSLLQDDVLVSCRREGRLIGLAFERREDGALVMRFGHEFLLRVCWQLADWLQGNRPRPRGFDFSFELPTELAHDPSVYERIFPAAQRFAQPWTAVWFDSAEMALPFRRGEQDLHEFLRSTPANVIVPGLIPIGTGARVQSLLRRAAPDWPDLPEIASELSMSVSSLQRHLASERMSFRMIKDALRRDMALEALRTSRVSLAMLANELGFADTAAFQRAFKTWTGVAPGQYRQQHRQLPRQI